ncbi:MAG: nucleotidyltransferase family protein, partial [Alphaproteobacteria bacterium]
PDLAGVYQIPNPHFSDGMSGSVRVGISAIQRHAQAVKGVMVLPADKPHIHWQTLDDLASAANSTPLRATYQGTPGHPAYLPAHLFPALLALEGDQGARSLDLTWHELALDDPAIVEDVDTWDDYERILTHWPNSS